MNKRPLCQVLLGMMLCIGLMKYLGISWLWKSPMGTLPFAWAAQEKSVEVTGVVYQQEQKNYSNQTYTYLYLNQTNLFIQSEKYPIRRIKCTMEDEMEDLLGAQVCLDGILSQPDTSTNPGEFNVRVWEASRKIDFYLEDISNIEVIADANSSEKITTQIKERGREILFQIFPKEEAGILEAMVFGDKSSLEDETQNQFQAAGISHIIAISGLHMSLIGMGIWNICKWIGLPMWLAATGSVGLLVGYGVVLDNPTTAFRALLMFGIMMGAKILGRSYDLLSALAAAGIMLLFDNPDILESSGFQLSFGAVLGMGSYSRIEEEIFQKVWNSKAKWSSSLRAGLFLWFFSLPIVLYWFYQVSLAGILINLIVIPLMPLVLGSGLAAIFLGMISIGVGSVAGIPAYFLLKGYVFVGKMAELCPVGMWTPGKPQIWQIVLYYIVLFCAAYGVKYAEHIFDANQRLKQKIWIAEEICIRMILVLLISAPWHMPDKATFLDVGQGDGIVLQSGGNRMLVDGGSSSRKNIGKYVLIPYLKYEGIAYLDMIFVTHSDADHMNGVLELLEENKKGWFQVGAVAMPYWMRNTEEGVSIVDLAREGGTEVVYLKAGDQITFGDTIIDIVYPQEEDFSEDSNAGSLVFKWKTKVGVGLFTGDLPDTHETEILNRLEPCLFLKLGHHGANGSTSISLLEVTQPTIGFISCGRNNRYGHPGKELLERLRLFECGIYRTDLQGALTIDVSSGEVRIFSCPSEKKRLY